MRLNRDNAAEVAFLSLATLYSFTIPLKGSISLLDMLILFSFFAGYLWRRSKMAVEHHEIIGPAAKLADLPKMQRRLGVLAIVVIAAIVILSVAKPFAEALVAAGSDLGIDSFLLVQWLAPLASEAAEFVVCVIFALKLMPTAALGTLISSKINQWTLLVAMLPLVFSLGASFQQGSTQLLSLPLGDRQNAEFFLTAAQSLFSTAVLLTLSLNLRNAMMLFSLFATQVAFGFIMRDDPAGTTLTLNIFAWIYLSLAVSIIVISLPAVRELVRVGLFNRESRLLDRLGDDEADAPVGATQPHADDLPKAEPVAVAAEERQPVRARQSLTTL